MSSAEGWSISKDGSFLIDDFRFTSGERIEQLRIHYLTIGDPGGLPVLILHGTNGSARGMLTPAFAGELFGPGQVLDSARYFIILADAIGAGQSSKPSDGLRAHFPRYGSRDMVQAQYRLVKEHLGVERLRLLLGNSMGGMHTWLWAQQYPHMMDIAVPMACMPIELSGRNWMLRRLIIDSIRNDPAWMQGNYLEQPPSARFASAFYSLATNGGTVALARQAPSRAAADALVDERLSTPFALDANDCLYQWESSRDYQPNAGLEQIEASVLAINSTDDERNPPELGVMEREIRRVKKGQVMWIPGGPGTAGHATAGLARFWKNEVGELLERAEVQACRVQAR